MAGTGRKNGLIALSLAVALFLTAGPAPGQISTNQMRDRYERNTKGKDIDDYVRKLNAEEPDKRLEGVKSLGDAKDPKAVEYLVQALGDTDMRIKAKAIDTLGDLRATDATPVLIQHLFLRETASEVKQRILASLGKIGDPQAAGSIVEFLRRDLNPDVQGTAIFALGEIGSSEALPQLQQIQETSKNPTLQRLAREASAKINYHQSMLKTEAKQPEATFLKKDQPPAPQ